MPKEFVDFWKRMKWTSTSKAHPDDRDALQRLGSAVDSQTSSLKEFVSKNRKADDKTIYLSLLPVPYVGDLDRADIIVLTLNPGLHYSDFYAEKCRSDFSAALIGMLRQSFNGQVAPFLFLDPQFCWHPGFHYWEKKLRKTVECIAEDTKVPYHRALDDLARRLAVVQLIPYHSKKSPSNLQDVLQSSKEAKSYAHRLAATARQQKKTVIVLRGSWGLDNSTDVYVGNATLAASLGPEHGGKAIIMRYRGERWLKSGRA